MSNKTVVDLHRDSKEGLSYGAARQSAIRATTGGKLHYVPLYRYGYRLTGSSVRRGRPDPGNLLQGPAQPGPSSATRQKATAWLFRILRNAYLHRARFGAQPGLRLPDDSIGDLAGRSAPNRPSRSIRNRCSGLCRNFRRCSERRSSCITSRISVIVTLPSRWTCRSAR